MPRRDWNSDEQLMALRLYCVLPFGKLHQSNPDVIAIAETIGRTPSAVAMKACNFASLDPALNRKGLGNVAKADMALWAAFQQDSELVASQMETAYEKMIESGTQAEEVEPFKLPTGETEVVRQVRIRRVQNFFRRAVMVGYDFRCAISGLSISDLLIASHIIPWSADEKRRADPTNGIALNALYDRAFDKGLIAFDDDFRVIVSSTLKSEMNSIEHAAKLFDIENQQLNMPVRFRPDLEAIRYHRNLIYQQ